MTEESRSLLAEAGIDVEDALNRVMGSESLLERILKKFPDDPNYARLCHGLETGDGEEAFRAAHTLKGVCGNLSMTRLFRLASRQVELLRGGDQEGARALMDEVSREYEALVGAVRRCFSV